MKGMELAGKASRECLDLIRVRSRISLNGTDGRVSEGVNPREDRWFNSILPCHFN